MRRRGGRASRPSAGSGVRWPSTRQATPFGRDRGGMQTPAEFGWRTVALAVVAAGAGGYDVLPGVPAAPAAWQHVVDGLGRPPAVGAPAAVAGEDARRDRPMWVRYGTRT